MDTVDTRTGFKRRYIFWFLVVTPFIFILLKALGLDVTEQTINGIFNFSLATNTLLLGTKANDVYQKRLNNRDTNNKG